MAWCDHYEFVIGNEQIFAFIPTAIRFGAGALEEIGHDASAMGLSRVAVFSDKMVAAPEAMDTVRETSRKKAGSTPRVMPRRGLKLRISLSLPPAHSRAKAAATAMSRWGADR